MGGNRKPVAPTTGFVRHDRRTTDRVKSFRQRQVITLAEFLQCFAGVRRTGNGFLALCPAHDDRNPSLSITPAEDRLLLHCFAGCSVEAITAAIGLSLSDLFFPNSPSQSTAECSPRIALQAGSMSSFDRSEILPDRGENPVRTLTNVNRQAVQEPANLLGKVRGQQIPPRRVEVRNHRQTAAFEYHDTAGNVLAVKRRYDFTAIYDDGSEREEKTFRVSPSGLVLPLYRLPAVLSAVRQGWAVYLTEGERKADILETYIREEWGTHAVASSYGGHWRREMSATLTGGRVILIPDRDEAGKRTADRVIDDLCGVAASVALCDLADLLTALQAGEREQ